LNWENISSDIIGFCIWMYLTKGYKGVFEDSELSVRFGYSLGWKVFKNSYGSIPNEILDLFRNSLGKLSNRFH
jgi:hypothetical protein